MIGSGFHDFVVGLPHPKTLSFGSLINRTLYNISPSIGNIDLPATFTFSDLLRAVQTAPYIGYILDSVNDAASTTSYHLGSKTYPNLLLDSEPTGPFLSPGPVYAWRLGARTLIRERNKAYVVDSDRVIEVPAPSNLLELYYRLLDLFRKRHYVDDVSMYGDALLFRDPSRIISNPFPSHPDAPGVSSRVISLGSSSKGKSAVKDSATLFTITAVSGNRVRTFESPVLPENISDGVSVTYDSESLRGSAGPYRFYNHGNARRISFNVNFHQQMFTQIMLSELVSHLESFVKPKVSDMYSVEPTVCSVVLPGLSFSAYLSDLTTSYSGFQMANESLISESKESSTGYSSVEVGFTFEVISGGTVDYKTSSSKSVTALSFDGFISYGKRRNEMERNLFAVSG